MAAISPENNITTTAMEQQQKQQELPTGLTDAQDKLLAMLPIPSSILSIVGSTIIIYIILGNRGRRRWTPYSRLLLGMSVCDIVSSISIAIAGFLRPQDTSIRAWAFGNDATCTITGFLIQFSWSGMFYYNMLSLYFLLSTRFGMKNSIIGRRIEPSMHFVAVGYPLFTGIAGAIAGVYSETSASFGCWVNDYPRGCQEDQGTECASVIIGWIFYGVPFWISALMLAFNNIAIFLFVRNQVKSCQSRMNGTTAAQSSRGVLLPNIQEDKQVENLVNNVPDEPFMADNKSQKQDGNATISVSFTQSMNSQCYQIKRLRLVRSQALLFVVAYTLSVAWGAFVIFIESLASTKADEIEMTVTYFPALVGNAIFAPLAGFLNCLVFLRPKYLRWKHKNPQNTNLREFWRTLFEASTSRRQKASALPRKPLEKKGHAVEVSGPVEHTSSSKHSGISSLTTSFHNNSNEALVAIRGRQNGSDSDGWLSSDSLSTFHSSGHFEESAGIHPISEITSSVFDSASNDDGWNASSMDSDILSSDMLSSGSNTTLSSHPPALSPTPPSEPLMVDDSLRSQDRWSASSSPRLVRHNASGILPADEIPQTPSRQRERLCRWSSATSSESFQSPGGGNICDGRLAMPRRAVSTEGDDGQDGEDRSEVVFIPNMPDFESTPP